MHVELVAKLLLFAYICTSCHMYEKQRESVLSLLLVQASVNSFVVNSTLFNSLGLSKLPTACLRTFALVFRKRY